MVEKKSSLVKRMAWHQTHDHMTQSQNIDQKSFNETSLYFVAENLIPEVAAFLHVPIKGVSPAWWYWEIVLTPEGQWFHNW